MSVITDLTAREVAMVDAIERAIANCGGCWGDGESCPECDYLRAALASPHPIARAGLDVGLREPSSTAPSGCYCTEICMAPVVMGNQAACRRGGIPGQKAPPRPPDTEARDTYQERVGHWMQECFGPEISADKLERNDRFIEEALELVQSLGYDAARAHALVDYVFGRPVGDPAQEVGGVTVTLSALCNAAGLNIFACGENELSRITKPEVIAKIRAKQAAKPTGSALPIPVEANLQGNLAGSVDPYAHADGSRECRPAAGKWSRPDAEARARELLAEIFEAFGDKLAAFTLRRVGPLGTVLHAQVDLLAKALAPAERGAIVEECARVADRHAAPDGVPQSDYDQACHDIAAAIRQIKGEGNG